MAPRWRLYYADFSVVEGETAAEWVAALDEDVQVVVLMEPEPNAPYPGWSPWGCPDRQLWTGQDEYRLFDWLPKRGSWMRREDYDRIWQRACSDG